MFIKDILFGFFFFIDIEVIHSKKAFLYKYWKLFKLFTQQPDSVISAVSSDTFCNEFGLARLSGELNPAKGNNICHKTSQLVGAIELKIKQARFVEKMYY